MAQIEPQVKKVDKSKDFRAFMKSAKAEVKESESTIQWNLESDSLNVSALRGLYTDFYCLFVKFIKFM